MSKNYAVKLLVSVRCSSDGLHYWLSWLILILIFRPVPDIAEDRDTLNNDPRRLQITKQIRDIEDAMEKLRRQIDDESTILESLKLLSDAQNSLVTLNEQCEKEIDVLEENIREESYNLNKFSVVSPGQLPRNEDEDGEQLMKVVDSMMERAREMYDMADGCLDKSKEETLTTQKIIAEKSAVLAGNQKTLASVKAKLLALAGSLVEVQTTVEELRQHEFQLGLTLTANENKPREVVQYIDDRLKELEDDSPDVNFGKVARKVLNRLRKMVCS
jgi:DNA repair exonuclease SbcCD ATPase subunit